MTRRNTRNGTNPPDLNFDDDGQYDQDERERRYYQRQKEKQKKEEQLNLQSKAIIYWYSL